MSCNCGKRKVVPGVKRPTVAKRSAVSEKIVTTKPSRRFRRRASR